MEDGLVIVDGKIIWQMTNPVIIKNYYIAVQKSSAWLCFNNFLFNYRFLYFSSLIIRVISFLIVREWSSNLTILYMHGGHYP